MREGISVVMVFGVVGGVWAGQEWWWDGWELRVAELGVRARDVD